MMLLANLFASAMFAVGLGLLTAILLRRSYRYFGRSRGNRNEGPIAVQPRPQSEWSGAYSDASARVKRQEVELYDLGRELKAQLDNKIIVLEELCAQSQRQIDRLEALLEESQRKAVASGQ